MTSPSSSAQPLRSVGRAIRYWHTIIWGTAVLGVLVALVVAKVTPPTYQATAYLSLNETVNLNQGFDLALQADQFMAQHYVSLASTPSLLTQVCGDVGGSCTPAKLTNQISVAPTRDAGQLAVNATGSTPELAAKIANSVASRLVARNQSDVAAATGPTRAYLQSEQTRLAAQAASLNQQLQAIQNSGRLDTWITNAAAPLLAQLQSVQTQQATTTTALQTAEVQQRNLSNVLSLQEPARLPTTPLMPTLSRYLPIGLGAGLLLGFLGALLAERFDPRIRDTKDLAQATAADVVLDLRGGASAAAECYALIAHAGVIALSSPGGDSAHARHGVVGAQDVLVVAASPRDDVDSVGRQLAEAAADGGSRVKLALAGGPANAASEPEEEALVAVDTAASRRSRPAPTRFDLAITCSEAPTIAPRALLAARGSDFALIVATRGRTTFADAQRTAELLRRAGVQVPAAILLQAPSQALRALLGGEPASLPKPA